MVKGSLILPLIAENDYVIHLGDGAGDMRQARSLYPEKVYACAGNCDFFSPLPEDGEIEVEGVSAENIAALLHKLRENGCKIYAKNDKIELYSNGRLKSVDLVETMPFPGFPTDMQPQISVTLGLSAGHTSVIKESIFENRFKFMQEIIGIIRIHYNICMHSRIKKDPVRLF